MDQRAKLVRPRIAALWITAALVVASLSFLVGPTASADTDHQGSAKGNAQESGRTVSIECGGYDEDGELVNPRAASIEEAPLTADGLIEIPDVCGGYTADGTYIGDI